MKRSLRLLLLAAIAIGTTSTAMAEKLSLKITKRYINMPVCNSVDRRVMTISSGDFVEKFDIRLTADKADYWVFRDVSEFEGQEITFDYDGAAGALSKIYQADQIAGADSLYKERSRPQVTFTTRRGWNNDPNGMCYYDGEYHLFFQHNPYEDQWSNMTWGHAVSPDMIHWEELGDAIRPDDLGTIFSGSAVVDYDNTSGFGEPGNPAMVAIYTSAGAKQTQSIAYSLDKGLTWTKYENNPVIDSYDQWQSGDLRDPKVFWHKKSKQWVMALFERDGISIYNSDNLRDWEYKSQTIGFWECPELFELPVDGNKRKSLWVLMDASGSYMLGDFDGEEFTPKSGLLQYTTGTTFAAQSFTGMAPGDDRRVLMSWINIGHANTGVTGCLSIPYEVTLRTTINGVRLFSEPIKELESLQTKVLEATDLTPEQATEKLAEFKDLETMRLKVSITPSHFLGLYIKLNDDYPFYYDMSGNKIHGAFYSHSHSDSAEITIDMIVDKGVVQTFIDGGALSYNTQCAMPTQRTGFSILGVYPGTKVNKLELYSLSSAWK